MCMLSASRPQSALTLLRDRPNYCRCCTFAPTRKATLFDCSDADGVDGDDDDGGDEAYRENNPHFRFDPGRIRYRFDSIASFVDFP